MARIASIVIFTLFLLSPQGCVSSLSFPDEGDSSSFTAVLPLLFKHQPAPSNWALLEEEQDDLPYAYYSPDADSATHDSPFRTMTNLVIVPCHAIYLGNSSALRASFNLSTNSCIQSVSSHSAFSAHLIDNWILEEYQVPQLHHFITHLKTSLQILADDPRAILIFSGGSTRAAAGSISEAASYRAYAIDHDWFGHPDSVWRRVITEDYAKDSYENLLYSICRFKEHTDYYPFHTTVIGFPFKSWRFLYLHRVSIRYPLDRIACPLVVSYPNGTAPTSPTESDWENDPLAIFRDSAIKLFEESTLVCTPTLQRKKQSRNPFRRRHAYREICPDLRQFFQCEVAA